ncbi:MAG: hypothetical protein NTNFB01_04720 [Nitrospira sp.]
MGSPNITCVCIWPTAKELLVAAGYQKPNSGALFVGLSSVMRSVLMDSQANKDRNGRVDYNGGSATGQATAMVSTGRGIEP